MGSGDGGRGEAGLQLPRYRRMRGATKALRAVVEKRSYSRCPGRPRTGLAGISRVALRPLSAYVAALRALGCSASCRPAIVLAVDLMTSSLLGEIVVGAVDAGLSPPAAPPPTCHHLRHGWDLGEG